VKEKRLREEKIRENKRDMGLEMVLQMDAEIEYHCDINARLWAD
jgi:hypothetical protein